MAIILEQGSDRGWAVRRNGILLIRTATETDWQAMLNGLVLVFNVDPQQVNYATPEQARAAWSECIKHTDEILEIAECRVTSI